ncbi:MAG: 5'/3'-nucleotidase SurE [Chloroflexota bacterium]|nr:5'/3'-nucleotidase SurE [Chloroflexota bacterium]
MSYILLTNDDGIHHAGLLALKDALAALGEVIVTAPDHNWSAAGHTKTMHKPLRVKETTLSDGTLAHTTTGAPSDCVALVLLGVLGPRRPDLVVSGINQGANVGQDITYSGTVAAAMEGVISGIPSIAISLDSYEVQDFTYAAQVGAGVARLVLQHGLPSHTLLNVNVPALPAEQIAGVRATRLGRRVYRDVLVARQDPRGRPYYWIGGEPPGGAVDEEGTDIWALAQGYVSISPLQMDMTEHKLLPEIENWLADWPLDAGRR